MNGRIITENALPDVKGGRMFTTVSELITALQTFPPESRVLLSLSYQYETDDDCDTARTVDCPLWVWMREEKGYYGEGPIVEIGG